MADAKELPEGTDAVISGASVENENEEALIVREPTTRDRMLDKVREGRGKLAGQAADKTRGLVGQGLERGSEALANVSKLVGDTAEGLDDRLGEEYGDYARRAAETLENTANRLASKDPDELIEDHWLWPTHKLLPFHMKHPITGEEMVAERWEGDKKREEERTARKKAEAAAAVTG